MRKFRTMSQAQKVSMTKDRRPDDLTRRLSRIRKALPDPVKRPLRWLRDRITPEGRMLRELAVKHGSALLQPAPVTWRDRHPEFFTLAQRKLANIAAPRILSYGCSTGEEVFTLARYIPHARIDGLDINPRSIGIAQRAVEAGDVDRIHFACASAPPEDVAIYDAIFCLSVLRHGRLDHEQIEDCSHILPFSRFAEVIEALDRTLKPGGLLFLWGSNFRFADTETAKNYSHIPTPDKPAQPGLFYGPDNLRLAIKSTQEFLFEKRT